MHSGDLAGRLFRRFVLRFGSLLLHFDQVGRDFVRDRADNTGERLFREGVFDVDVVELLRVIKTVINMLEAMVIGLLEHFFLHLGLLRRVVVAALALRLDRATHSLVLATDTSATLPDILVSVPPIRRVSQVATPASLTVDVIVVEGLDIDILDSVVGLGVVSDDRLQPVRLNTHELPHHSHLHILTTVLRYRQVAGRMVLFIAHDNMRNQW